MLKKTGKKRVSLGRSFSTAYESLTNLLELPADSDGRDELKAEITESLTRLAESLPEAKPKNVEDVIKQMFDVDFFPVVIENLDVLEFEAWRVVMNLFCFVVNFGNESKKDADKIITTVAVKHIAAHPEIMDALWKKAADPDMTKYCGEMLRQCLRYRRLLKPVLDSDYFLEIFDRIQEKSFDAGADHLATFKEALLSKPKMVIPFLEKCYDEFFGRLGEVMVNKDSNIVVQLACAEVLAGILYCHTDVAARWLSDDAHLKQTLLLLSNPAIAMKVTGFKIFCLFMEVEEARRSEDVAHLLSNNKDRLMAVIEGIDASEERSLGVPLEAFKQQQMNVVANLAKLST